MLDKVKIMLEVLARVQRDFYQDPSNSLLREEEMVYAQAYKKASIDEEKLLQQKSKVQWLKEGDFNSSYFHKTVKSRVSRNRIVLIHDDLGNVYKGDEVAK